VRAAGWQPTRSAGSGLPALPAFSSWFVIWKIPKFMKADTFLVIRLRLGELLKQESQRVEM
jgi:hypothetical protein